MFQFTTTTVINSLYATDYNGVPLVDDQGNNVPKFKGENGEFVVAKVGTYKLDKIKALYKKAYTAGVRSVATLTVADTALNDKLRLTIYVNLEGSAQSDYVSHYMDFKQPITVEVTGTGTAATDATNLAAAVNKIKTYFGRGLITASASGAVITFKAKENEQRFGKIVLEKVGAQPATAIAPTLTQLAAGTVTVQGKSGFGDDLWMVKSIRIPTYGNNRAFGINKEETPILGGNYSQYTIHYEVPSQQKFVYYGGMTSQTTHVFYVAASLVTSFESALRNAGLVVGLNASDLTIDEEDTAQLIVSGNVGTLTYVSATTAVATVSDNGIVTGVSAGTSVITITDSAGNTTTVTVTVTVEA